MSKAARSTYDSTLAFFSRHSQFSGSFQFCKASTPSIPGWPKPLLTLDIPQCDWLGSLGVNSGAAEPEITHIAAGHGHALIAFRGVGGAESVFAIGRNESGQLGIGYNSQEPTRGLVEGFGGDYIEELQCGITSSYLRVKQGDQSVVYACGNQNRGQLGIPPALTQGDRPLQSFTSRATIVSPPGASVQQLATGFEHALILSDGKLFGTGVNTDGQLGMSDDVDRLTFSEISIPTQLIEDGIASVHAGADTSAFISNEGDLWTFGNSEYAQAFHGKIIDRILEPKLMDWALIGLPKVKSFCTGGSFSLLLNEQGLVYAAGYGSIGQQSNVLQATKPVIISGLKQITQIHAGAGYAAAVNTYTDD
ncbi:MAG: hypothetical protein CYPHOPRED_005640 [Cyphobasidiales sp. Tagirdzhanova-0007]|nr:MAG: hypothetical protein CYPHOPRED_005640 [Cyphobasidiales sp. Tagirdzhanova-0007]